MASGRVGVLGSHFGLGKEAVKTDGTHDTRTHTHTHTHTCTHTYTHIQTHRVLKDVLIWN